MIRLLLLSALTVSAASVRVQVDGRIVELELEQYVAGVLSGESGVFKSEEALKAMSVAARTYAVRFRGRHASDGFDLCDTTHCQRVELRDIPARLLEATRKTAGELLWFDGKPALAYYTQDCGGRSEDAATVWPDASAPYLKSRVDPYCSRSGESHWHWESTPAELAAAIQRAGLRAPRVERIAVVERSPSNRVKTLALSGQGQSVRISASSLRFAVGRVLGWNTVRSDDYETALAGGRLIFDGRGAGHGVGLCQLGADQMGKDGRNYRDILAFYYPGTVVGLTAKGLQWRSVGGESVTLMTTQPEKDSSIAAIAERQVRVAAERVRLPVPAGIEIRVYPDVETFRNATGEPGWVAARTTGGRIELQPSDVLRSRGVLESTLRHELMHAILEANARPGLPVWFREGLAAYLENGRASAAGAVDDTGVRQNADQARARAANESARRRVAELVRRYGEGAVLSWLKTGLPREVTNASANAAPTKSK